MRRPIAGVAVEHVVAVLPQAVSSPPRASSRSLPASPSITLAASVASMQSPPAPPRHPHLKGGVALLV
jgi:hypothetical protein